ncbi:pep a2, partial [Streptomyces sp. NPDC060194]|uniref:pep a2 n=1 Tax=Streptomyces sp. NPDC060194 TaxID=3347069 RepID=UPI0036572420
MRSAVPRYYHLDVEVTPERVGQVRRILTAHLRYWKLGHLAGSVCHCVEVLLHTIDEHAKDKSVVIETWWNGHHLITAVSYRERDLPMPHYEPSGCLAQIAAHSDGWGGCATADGGKIIWFSRRDRAAERAPLVAVAPVPDADESLDVPRTPRAPALVGSRLDDAAALLVAEPPAAEAA